MKIVFFATSEIAVPALESLIKNPKTEVLAVVTQPDKKAGRDQALMSPAIKKAAEVLGLKIMQPQNKAELITQTKDLKADFFVVMSYGMILPKEVLKIPRYGAVNIHASLLPRYRGASPIQEALLHGDKETGITFILMDEELDHGPILLIRKIEIEKKDDLKSLSLKIAFLSAELLPLVLEDRKEGVFGPIHQQHEKATFTRKISKEDGKINFTKSAEEILNMIRAYTPWPSVWTEFNGKKIKILAAEVENKNTNTKEKTPGSFFLEDKTLKIATTNGILIPTLLQPEGKKEMDAKSFLNGYGKMIKE